MLTMGPDHTTVAIVKYDDTSNAVAKAVQLCNGLKGLNRADRVLLKPNIVWGAGGTGKVPKFGLITTARVIEEIVKLLRDYGCTKIALGEGTIADKELGSDTMKGYRWSGMERVAKKYGVTLIDFNREPYREAELDGEKIKIAESALDADFLINVPVLKTHAQCRVSLGLKNLKGCLSMGSKRAFHRNDLHRMIALLNTRVIPSLTVIDGIYALEHGPTATGTAHRMNVIIAGRDSLSCDVVGSTVLGIDPAAVGHVKEFAALHKRSIDVNTIDLQGEKIEDVSKKLAWEFAGNDVLRKAGVQGISIPYPGTHFCTQCVTHTEAVLLSFCKDNAGMRFSDVELCVGSEVKPRKDSKKVFLFGECALRANKDREGTITVKGCPPKAADMLMALSYGTLGRGRATRNMLAKIIKTIGYRMGVYHEEYPEFTRYSPPIFDENHFV